MQLSFALIMPTIFNKHFLEGQPLFFDRGTVTNGTSPLFTLEYRFFPQHTSISLIVECYNHLGPSPLSTRHYAMFRHGCIISKH